MNEVRFLEKAASRKFILAVLVIVSGTVLLGFPSILSLFGISTSSVLGGSEYATLMIGVFGIYSGANVAQKKVDFSVLKERRGSDDKDNREADNLGK